MPHIRNIYDELGWKQADGYPVGTRIKTLRNDESGKTILLKLPKGFHMEPHAHTVTEQHMILDGEYESEGEVFPSGTYRLIHAHQNHGPFTSKAGAIILVIWDPIK